MEITGPSVEAGEAYGVDNHVLYIIKRNPAAGDGSGILVRGIISKATGKDGWNDYLPSADTPQTSTKSLAALISSPRPTGEMCGADLSKSGLA